MSDVDTWGTDASNSYQSRQATPNGAPEGWLYDQMNNVQREVMAAVRRWFDDSEYVNLHLLDPATDTPINVIRNGDAVFTVEGFDATGIYTTGRRIKMVGDSTTFGFVTSTNFTSGNTIVTLDGGPVPTGALTVLCHHSPTLRRDAFEAQTPIYPTGAVFTGHFDTNVEYPGCVHHVEGGTLGAFGSGATVRANSDAENLWKQLYDIYPDATCPVSGGRTTRDADWSAGKTLQLPPLSGLVLGVTGTGTSLGGLSPRALDDVVGEEQHELTAAEMQHGHDTSTRAEGVNPSLSAKVTGVEGVENVTAVPHNVMQPTRFCPALIAL